MLEVHVEDEMSSHVRNLEAENLELKKRIIVLKAEIKGFIGPWKHTGDKNE
jgi:hypothetical protein